MNPSTIIGREEELSTISRLYSSDRSEFLAIYGRRRVGKSFLIEEALENKFTFMTVGLYIKVDKDDTEKVESYRHSRHSPEACLRVPALTGPCIRMMRTPTFRAVIW